MVDSYWLIGRRGVFISNPNSFVKFNCLKHFEASSRFSRNPARPSAPLTSRLRLTILLDSRIIQFILGENS
ncbi:hypothetical protein L1987_36683 [Smallanthus sonchifolius]|uniref:Uncharacterized protein n=1 Tax=Smallanthus sonchifolius TaxID=185202 RepID=A0ACB9HFI4_9ASTR|nr:hypothetical protein L1987_36683 [Smallanthus sonchifolius]